MTEIKAAGTALLEIKELQHSYGAHDVLQLDHWRLNEGENQLLLGPSGSGKTTFLSILSGLLQPSSGQIWVQGRQISGMKPRELDKLRASTFGLVFQDHHLVSSLTLEENLDFAQYFARKKADPDWAPHLLSRLGLSDKKHSKPASLSRGEAQRAALARAAICRPPIMIADEPTSALDDRNCERVAELLQDLCQEWGATLLVASHDARIKRFFTKTLELGEEGKVAA